MISGRRRQSASAAGEPTDSARLILEAIVRLWFTLRYLRQRRRETRPASSPSSCRQVLLGQKRRHLLGNCRYPFLLRDLPQSTVEGRGKTKTQCYAKATFKKDRRVNIRISGKDLEAIQKRAVEEGIPYQTLIASLLHKYVSGRLVEKAA